VVGFKVFVSGAGVIEFALVFVVLEHVNAGGWLVCLVCSSFHSVHSGDYQTWTWLSATVQGDVALFVASLGFAVWDKGGQRGKMNSRHTALVSLPPIYLSIRIIVESV